MLAAEAKQIREMMAPATAIMARLRIMTALS
jgi:hypothetical protein